MSTPETNGTVSLSQPAAFYRVAAPPSGSSMATVNDFIPKTYQDTNGGTLPYRLFVPSQYDARQKYPLVLFLHGHPERGTDNEAQLSYKPSPLVFVSPANQAKHPCFMAAPQCPPDGVWVDTTRRRQLRELVSMLQASYSLDSERLYVTGLSVGGSGVWDSLTQNPDLFAAGIPIAGNVSFSTQILSLISHITNSTVWAFGAADDEVFNARDTDNLINRFRNSGGAAIYTRYFKGGHAIWNPAYATPGLVDWLMAQRKGSELSKSAITITSPAEASNFTTTQTNIHLAGVASSIAGPITNVVWTNILTHASGVAPGSTNWSFESVPLSPNATNILIVTCTSGSGSLQQLGITTANNSIFVISRSTP
jgi:poly(3-hydroxybutyrate) depolymerase